MQMHIKASPSNDTIELPARYLPWVTFVPTHLQCSKVLKCLTPFRKIKSVGINKKYFLNFCQNFQNAYPQLKIL